MLGGGPQKRGNAPELSVVAAMGFIEGCKTAPPIIGAKIA
jgi:hypothetical protein